MSLPSYFLSDAHLGVNGGRIVPLREEKLVKMLRSWQAKAERVVIVGDLFEFWWEYKHYVNRHHFGVLRALADLVDSGVQVDYIAGNHDFALGDFLPKQLGVQVHMRLQFQVQGRTILCVHGDGIAKADKGYRIARKVIDSRLNKRLFALLHPDWGMQLAFGVGGGSRHYNKDRAIPWNDYETAVAKMAQQSNCDLVVIGHVHHAFIKTLENHQQWASAGQWLFSLHYLALENGVLRLENVQ